MKRVPQISLQEAAALVKSGDIRGGTTEEKIAAIDGYLSYCGRFSVSGGRVVHHIEVSLFPNWTGTDQERFFEFKADTLTLSTPPILLDGQEQTSHLVWQKADLR